MSFSLLKILQQYFSVILSFELHWPILFQLSGDVVTCSDLKKKDSVRPLVRGSSYLSL